jgi:hypothetical protein
MAPETGKLLEICSWRPWFERFWVLQEAILPPLTLVVCGEDILKWDAIANTAAKLLSSGLGNVLIDSARVRIKKAQVLPGGLIHAGMIQQLKLELGDGQNGHIQRLLLMSTSFKATGSRDKIFGLLGIAADTHHVVFQPNYQESVEKLYRYITKHFIQQSQSLWICQVTGIGWKRDLINISSWTPDFSSMFGRGPLYNEAA